MRNTNQRVQAALCGAKKYRQKQKRRKLCAVLAGAYLASVCLVLACVGVIASVPLDAMSVASSTALTASVFASTQALRYIMVGLLSFALGTAVTLLCVLLHTKAKQEERQDDT